MYKKKKQFDSRYLLILIIVCVSLSLVILAICLKGDRKLNPVERGIKDLGTMTIKLVSSPIRFVKSKIDRNNEKEKIYKKYKSLLKEKEEYEKVKASNENLEETVKKLKKSLELNTVLSDQFMVNATVIYRKLNYWYDEITIDKGSKSGIEKDMAVVVPDGLIGRVSTVSKYTSTIKLISNDNMDNKLSVKIKVEDNYVYGLISKYDSKTNTYTVEGISENVNIPDEASVVTTGMGNIFPSGLLIGKVKGIKTDNFDLSKVLEVQSSVNFDDIDYVTILKRKK
ncbi:MAG: rod shape-determining protein MreC [Bacilli bacterium]|nr:rod shape-determining protein MreC [Bacilli bacterium]